MSAADRRDRAEARRKHVRNALREVHAALAERNPAGVAEKMKRIEQSAFVFFRGTADLYYRDLAGLDDDLPIVLCNGDVHPENFGVMRGFEGELVFGLNDFDDAHPAPFSWDLRRGATGFELLVRQRGERRRMRRRTTGAFMDGYVSALDGYRRDKNIDEPRFVIGASPGIIDDVLSHAASRSRRRFLDKRVHLEDGRLGQRDDIVSVPDRVPEFQAAIDAYRERLRDRAPDRRRFFRVKDVAEKHGSGTGSLGLQRYYALVEGGSKHYEDDVILELKEAVASAVAPHVSTPSPVRREGRRVALAHEVQLPSGDPLFGCTRLGKTCFVVRERGEHKRSVNVYETSTEELLEYARVCGEALAHAHARCRLSRGTGRGSPAKQILVALERHPLAETLREFAERSAERVEQDHALFVELRTDGAL
jgi:uncharacterized protein (DUF2252 family)